MKNRPSILFVSAFHTPFIQDDIDFLDRHYNVRKQIGHGLLAIIRIVIGVFQSDLVVCWFASVYAFVAVFIGNMIGVKSIVIVGGVDAAKDQDLNYGIWLSPWRARLVRYVFHNAACILVVDPCLKTEAMKLAEYDGKNIRYVPTGYDNQFWRPVGEKEPVILSVAVIRNVVNIRRKGIDTLVSAARLLPSVTFYVVGVERTMHAELNPPPNMKLYPPMPRRDVLPFYQQARVYCQASRREGLPNALCEAMLCGCIPVATDVSGNPTAVGNAGLLVLPGDETELAAALKNALSLDARFGIEARARIVSMFPKERRERELMRIIGEFVA